MKHSHEQTVESVQVLQESKLNKNKKNIHEGLMFPNFIKHSEFFRKFERNVHNKSTPLLTFPQSEILSG